jgi:hypothetical protein
MVRILSGCAALLGSGVVSAVGFVLITSNRWQLVKPAVGVFIVLFVQWQMLGLTIAKLGVDQVAFAVTTEDRSRVPSVTEHLRRRTFPLAAIFSLVVAVVFSPLAALVCLLSVLLDTDATVASADLNGRERFVAVAIANLLKYPLFFIVVFAVHATTGLTSVGALAAFLATSALRWLWLAAQREALKTLPRVVCTTNLAMGYQQLLNYITFRGDQLLLATGIGAAVIQTGGPDFLQKYLFLARYPDLVSGVMVVLGVVLLPRLFLPYPIEGFRLRSAVVRHWPWLLAYVAAIATPILFQSLLWQGSTIHRWLLVAFVASALLILPANVLTYSMIRQGHLAALVRNLTWAIVGGLVLNGVGYALSTPIPLVLTIPTQLSLFVTLGLTTSWGARKALYA